MIDMDTSSNIPYSAYTPQADQEQPQSLEYLEKQVAHLRTLQEISHKLNSKLDLEGVLTAVLDEAIRAVGAERGCLFLVDAATGKLEVRLRRHFPARDLDDKSFRLSQTVVERVWRDGQPVLTANAAQDPALTKAASVIKYTLRSILCVPLHLQEQPIGVLYLDNRLKAGQFQEDDLALAKAIADQAAVALRNAQLHQEIVDRVAKQMEVLQHIQSLNQLSFRVQGLTNLPDLFAAIGEELEQFGYHCAIVLLSPDRARFEVQYISLKGMAGSEISDCVEEIEYVSVNETIVCRRVLEARTGQFASDLDEVMTELLKRSIGWAHQPAFIAPLVANNQAIGLLVLGLGTYLEDTSLLMAFANHVAATIEVSRLQAELQQRLAEMQSTLAITRALVSEVGLDNLLGFIMAQAEHLTNAEGAAVLLLDDASQSLQLARPGEPWLRMKAGSNIPVHGSLVSLAIASGQVQVSNHAQEDEGSASVRALLRPIVLCSLLCAPLVAHRKSLGVLLVWNKRERGFSADDIRLMGLFADQSALALHNEQLHARNRYIAIEQERHRLARDLHDSATQSLYSIALAAQTSLRLLDRAHADRRLWEALEHIQATSRIVLAEMREQLYDLYPTPLGETGLVEALTQHCEFLRRHHSLQIELTAGQEPALSASRREALYYIAREALWNAVKYASATRAGVSLSIEAEHIVLSVADDGVGFEPSSLTQGKSMGLRNMEERAEQLGGTFELISSLGQGTCVTVRVPRRPAEDHGGL